ncbi:MAG: 1-phosphofructokinase family hexose kinase [Deltaproteobacteria bacterium]|jgi:tagatose 6-phosphate kinase|nr:1-phosphofructokinase family hexose kinase [Deltaproteobacteria bacterium]
MIITVTMNASVDKRYRVDSLEPGTVIRLDSCRNTAGGKGLNVTRVLRQLNCEVLAVGVAAGRNGDFIEEELNALGIRHCFARAKGESRCCVNVVEASSGRQTEFLEPGPTLDPTAIYDFTSRFTMAVESGSIVSLSGSLPQGLPPGFYGRLASMAGGSGARVIVDSSGESLSESLTGSPVLVKPNLEEAGALLGRRLSGLADAAWAATQLMARGAGAVAVSMGADGVVYAGPDGVIRGKPPKITPRNAVGCGDAMVAGFAVGLAEGWDAPRSVRYAVALSAASALCEETGAFRESDLEDMLPRVEMARLS